MLDSIATEKVLHQTPISCFNSLIDNISKVFPSKIFLSNNRQQGTHNLVNQRHIVDTHRLRAQNNDHSKLEKYFHQRHI